MAIEYTLAMQGHTLTNDMLLNTLAQIGFRCDAPVKLEGGIGINHLTDTVGVAIYLISSGRPL